MAQATVISTSLGRVVHLAQNVARLDSQASQARRELVEAMREAYGVFTLQEIGDAANISRERVRQLLLKEAT